MSTRLLVFVVGMILMLHVLGIEKQLDRIEQALRPAPSITTGL